MDYQGYVDCCGMACSVLSVEKKPDGRYGDIRIICSNQLYKDTMGPAYYDGMMYYELVPQDPKFEDFCYRAAILKQRMHAYVETKALGCWTDQTLIPLESDRDDMGYCQFVFEFTKGADASRMAGVSVDTAAAVIEASITLMDTGDFVGNVKKVLDNIVDLTGSHNCRIMLVDRDKRIASVFCESLRDKEFEAQLRARGQRSVEIPYEIVETWEDMIGVSNAVIVKDAADMERLAQRNPEWVANMRQYHVESLVLIPLRRGGHVAGYLYVVDFDVDRIVEVKELIELMSFFLGSEISNYLLMNKLEEMSNVDGLTGVLNRHAMNRDLADLDRNRGSESFGVVNFDLNGLKTVNDRDGHDAGDQLLVAAADVLKGAFGNEKLYRTGGDEFVVLARGLSRESFDEKVNRMREVNCGDGPVRFAMGAYWSDGSVDTREAFIEADGRMYQDKKAYYEAHPGENRRSAKP